MSAPLAGVVPVVPTIFHDDETVDLGGTARVVDYLMDAGVDGLCLLANYSEQFSLTDAERDAIARTLLERIAGRLPVIVTTSHYSARVAAARSRAAQDMGAAMVMIMPPFFGATLTAGGPAVIEYFKQVAGAIRHPGHGAGRPRIADAAAGQPADRPGPAGTPGAVRQDRGAAGGGQAACTGQRPWRRPARPFRRRRVGHLDPGPGRRGHRHHAQLDGPRRTWPDPPPLPLRLTGPAR